MTPPASSTKKTGNKQDKPYVVGPDGSHIPWLCNTRHQLLSNVANAITMMDALPLRYNSFTCRPFLADESPWGTQGTWTDYDDIKAAEWCQRNHLNIEKGTAADAAMSISIARRPHFHPVLEYLLGLEWDKEPRLDRWLYRYMGCADDVYTRGVAAMWMMSAIKRVTDPNIVSARRPNWNQADYTLVFEGSQGRRKSTALRALAGAEWFSDDLGAEIPHKDAAIGLQGKWIVELGELDAFRRAEMTTVKLWLVRREDHYRPPHARRAMDFPRQNIFAASTNKDQWLEDETGGRRFWPVKTGTIDVDGIEKARDQLWAEAYFRFSAGERTWFSEAGETIAAEQQLERQAVDAWRDRIEAWLAVPLRRGGEDAEMRTRLSKAYLDDVLWHCLGIPVKDHNQSSKNRVSRILTLSGWYKKREAKSQTDDDGVQREYWVPMKKL